MSVLTCGARADAAKEGDDADTITAAASMTPDR